MTCDPCGKDGRVAWGRGDSATGRRWFWGESLPNWRSCPRQGPGGSPVPPPGRTATTKQNIPAACQSVRFSRAAAPGAVGQTRAGAVGALCLPRPACQDRLCRRKQSVKVSHVGLRICAVTGRGVGSVPP